MCDHLGGLTTLSTQQTWMCNRLGGATTLSTQQTRMKALAKVETQMLGEFSLACGKLLMPEDHTKT
jgi:hypothetical protein